jgi:hypothetical protein
LYIIDAKGRMIAIVVEESKERCCGEEAEWGGK